MAIDLVATTGGRHTYNDSPLLMTPLAIGSNAIRGYEDSVVISLPLPAGLTHAPCQEMAKREAKTPCLGLGEPRAPGTPILPAAQACSHPGQLSENSTHFGVRWAWNLKPAIF